MRRTDGSIVEELLRDALITENLEEVYPVLDGVPVIQVFEVIDPSKLPMRFLPFDSESSDSPYAGMPSDGNVASKKTAALDPP